jgi:hypothetical protein
LTRLSIHVDRRLADRGRHFLFVSAEKKLDGLRGMFWLLALLLVVLVILASALWARKRTTSDQGAHVPLLPGPRLEHGQALNLIPGKTTRVQEMCTAPRVLLLTDLISDEENAHLRALAENRLHRSTVESSQSISSERTSSSADLKAGEDAIVQRIEARLASLCGYPVSHFEPLQVLKYGPGEQYRPHYDYFSANPGPSGQRHVSFLLYLNDENEGLQGGHTQFLKCASGTLNVKPQRNAGVLWFDCLPNGKEDERTLHAGMPPTSGIKFAMNCWIRSKPYR